MGENKPPPSSAAPPPISTTPVDSNIFTSPGPMSLVSSFFAENDPDNDYRSFSQLLAGAISPAAVPNVRSDVSHSTGGDNFRFQGNSSGDMFAVPQGFSIGERGFYAPSQGQFGLSHQQIMAQITAQAQAQAQPQAQMLFQPGYPSFSAVTASLSQPHSLPSNAASLQKASAPMVDQNIIKESSDASHSDQRSQPHSSAVDKPADDGYNWRKYGQKQVKGSEYPRSYYKCTQPNCPVRKKVERALDGQITEIIYKGQHNHPPTSKRAKDTGNLNESLKSHGNSELGFEGQTGNPNKLDGGVSYFSPSRDEESSQVTPEHISGSSESEGVGDAEKRRNGRHEDEPESKRRNVEVQTSEQASSQRTVTEPRIIVQTTSEVDLLDDGYRWRKYGQKVVKGNPYPRSYYKCTFPGCNVRKHVERAASDPKAVITTYEGKHNHDVPAAKASSHSTANAASQLRPNNTLVNRLPDRTQDFGNRDQQPVALLRFKEENIT